MAIYLHEGDLPSGLDLGNQVAVDSETLGLIHRRDRLCLVQLSAGDGDAHLVRLPKGEYDCPNLKALLSDPNVLKIFHFARFDVAIIQHYLGIKATPIYCTKIASKLVRTYTDRHGLKNLCAELIDVKLDKEQQSSDWGSDVISDAQQAYAASDVLYLHQLKDKLEMMLERENRTDLAQACFDFLPTRATLDLMGFEDMDIFSHR